MGEPVDILSINEYAGPRGWKKGEEREGIVSEKGSE